MGSLLLDSGMKLVSVFLCFSILLYPGVQGEPTDACYEKNLNCYISGSDLEIGHTTYLPDIEKCENGCRSLAGCKWFTWRNATDFSVCYFLMDCPFPTKGEEFTSGFLENCSEKLS